MKTKVTNKPKPVSKGPAKKATGKRVGKSKASKANNQLNRRVK